MRKFYQTLFPSLPLLHKHAIRGHFATGDFFSYYDSFKDMRRVIFGVLTVCVINLRSTVQCALHNVSGPLTIFADSRQLNIFVTFAVKQVAQGKGVLSAAG